ncbi:molybdopterin-containing oxidoreductase family protein [Raoultibacter phocaeensis]|uniref:molybdopterin-containing oxidoreductase family protein n=1 Tax=Raoultibacter phocaeensis TaxID=2479841 RepID=UPI001119EC17|nr:molybdopterin-dependent oxidoreductase [Raoultibacter phocaeensis]
MAAINCGETRYSTCVFCDGGCSVAVRNDGEITVSPLDPAAPAICSKARMWREYRDHPDRITQPLKNVGSRTAPKWEPVGWDWALDEIAERLSAVIDAWGPEAFAVSEMPLNTGFGGITRRFMNHLGSPNYMAPVLLCMGNTAQVHRATYGWFTAPDWDKADVIVYFGQNRGPELWPAEFLSLKAALERGAVLIEVDPRDTDTARLAHEHLRIRYGTDAALLLSWINVIIEEDLYDRAFVESSTVGFAELAARVREYPPETVASICGIDAETIRRTARLYARAEAAIIPWGVVGDMQKNSTSVLLCQCILRALCGFLNASELVFGPSEGQVTNTQLSDFVALSTEQKEKQLGSDEYPLLSFKGMELYDTASRAAGLDHIPDIMGCSCTAHPARVFEAMRTGAPYPVKAFFAVGNNTAMSYANQQGIIAALLAQELVVVFDHWMTPTAQLADYVLPGDAWMERDVVGPNFDVAPAATFNQAFCDPPGACKDWYYVVKGLADRLGLGEVFPWNDCHELYDYLLAPLGRTWAQTCEQPAIPTRPVAMGSFLTPSGKVELKSSVLEALGCDPLPSYEDPSEPGADCATYPLVVFAGARDKCSYNTNLHQIPALRKREPEPEAYLNPADVERFGLRDGAWVRVSTSHGSVQLVARADVRQPEGTLRVPHGWWKPEAPQGLDQGLSAACLHNDGMLFCDEPWNLDRVQGLPNLRGGVRARVENLE